MHTANTTHSLPPPITLPESNTTSSTTSISEDLKADETRSRRSTITHSPTATPLPSGDPDNTMPIVNRAPRIPNPNYRTFLPKRPNLQFKRGFRSSWQQKREDSDPLLGRKTGEEGAKKKRRGMGCEYYRCRDCCFSLERVGGMGYIFLKPPGALKRKRGK